MSPQGLSVARANYADTSLTDVSMVLLRRDQTMPTDSDYASSGAVFLKDRLPRLGRLVDALQMRDEGFREICIELAEAHAALGATRSLPPGRRRQREREWRECI